MRAVATISVLALALAAGACAGPTQAEFTKADREAIQKANTDLVAAFNARDLDSLITLYSAESLFMPPNNPSMRGPDAVRSFYQGLLDEGSATLTMASEEINGHGPLALQLGTYVLQSNGDGKASRDRGKYLRVLRNTAGTWRIEKTIWSSDLPHPAVVAAN
jgi:ketosteroid isomerase-like protein